MMANDKLGTGTAFLESLDVNRTIASVTQATPLRLTDIFKIFFSHEDKQEPKK